MLLVRGSRHSYFVGEPFRVAKSSSRSLVGDLSPFLLREGTSSV